MKKLLGLIILLLVTVAYTSEADVASRNTSKVR